MKRLHAATAAGVLVVVTIACDRSATAPSPAPAGSTSIVGLAIHGPERLAPGQTARFTATVTLSDRSTQDYTQKVTWNATPQGVLTIDRTTGEAIARTSGDAFVFATGLGFCCSSGTRLAILVLPPDTYRLTGRVQESGLSVQEATVAVVSGTGSGLSTTTDYNGQYRLYGVAGSVEIRVQKAGYIDLVKAFSASQNDVLDFPEARQAQGVPSISGSYTLTLQADSSCPTSTADPRTPHLPAEMQQARSYVVQVTQEGPSLHVTAVGPGFLPPSDRFDGRIMPDGVEFGIGDGYFGYGPDGAFAAYLSSTQALAYEGQIYASRVGSSIVGRLDGAIELYEKAPFNYRTIGQCRGGNHRFTMSASTPGTTR